MSFGWLLLLAGQMEVGSLAEWVSGFGTVGAVIAAIWLGWSESHRISKALRDDHNALVTAIEDVLRDLALTAEAVLDETTDPVAKIGWPGVATTFEDFLSEGHASLQRLASLPTKDANLIRLVSQALRKSAPLTFQLSGLADIPTAQALLRKYMEGFTALADEAAGRRIGS